MPHLVGWPVDRVLWPGHALVVRQRGKALERVVHCIEPRAQVDVSRARLSVSAVDDAKHRLERARGNARLEAERGNVDDGRAGRLGAGAGRRRDSNQRPERRLDGQALADRRVDVVEQVGVLLDGEAEGLSRSAKVGVNPKARRYVQVGRLGGVNDRSSANAAQEPHVSLWSR